MTCGEPMTLPWPPGRSPGGEGWPRSPSSPVPYRERSVLSPQLGQAPFERVLEAHQVI